MRKLIITLIVTREEKDKRKTDIDAKRGFYKKWMKRSSATDDIDTISKSKGSGDT